MILQIETKTNNQNFFMSQLKILMTRNKLFLFLDYLC